MRWIVTPVSLVAGHDRPLDRRGAAPARKQRRVDVQPERAVEQFGRNERAVRDDHDGVGVRVEAGEPLRLAHLDPQPPGDDLGRRRADVAASAARPVGPRQQIGDVVAGREPLQHVGAEGRRRGNRKTTPSY